MRSPGVSQRDRLHLGPIMAGVDVNLNRHIDDDVLHGLFHDAGDERSHDLQLTRGYAKNELIVHLQIISLFNFSSRRRWAILIIAILIRSACVPCTGMLIAARSAASLRVRVVELISGM